MNKRIFIFTILIIILIIFLLYLLFGREGNNKPTPKYSPSPTAFVTLSVSPTLTITKPLPTRFDTSEKKIEVNGIRVNNVYKNPVILNQRNDVTFFQNDRYEFVYLADFKEFIITITGSPFYVWINQAEEEFVKILGISKEEACRLDVKVSTVFSANPDYAGRVYQLSFCPK